MYPSKPTGNDIIPENTIFASNNTSKITMTSSEVLNGYNNDGESITPLTSCPDANRFNNFWYQVHNTVAWLIKYVEELYSDKFSKTGGTLSGNLVMGSGTKLSGIATPTQPTDAVPKSYLDSVLAGAMWLGEIKVMAYPNIPQLPDEIEVVPCDGRAISRTDYSELFSLIGTQFGVGDGTTTFNIPDYRGLFLRGWDGNSGRDTGRSYGSIQNTGAPLITHTHTGSTSSNGNHTHNRGTMEISGSFYTPQAINTSGVFTSSGTGFILQQVGYGYGNNINFYASRNWTGNTSQNGEHTHSLNINNNTSVSGVYQNINEVRPINSTCYYLIRIK